MYQRQVYVVKKKTYVISYLNTIQST